MAELVKLLVGRREPFGHGTKQTREEHFKRDHAVRPLWPVDVMACKPGAREVDWLGPPLERGVLTVRVVPRLPATRTCPQQQRACVASWMRQVSTLDGYVPGLALPAAGQRSPMARSATAPSLSRSSVGQGNCLLSQQLTWGLAWDFWHGSFLRVESRGIFFLPV